MNKVMKIIKYLLHVGYLCIGVYELIEGTPPLKYFLGICLIVLSILNMLAEKEK